MKIVIIGLGSIAQKHIQALEEINPKNQIFALRSNQQGKNYENVKNFYAWDEIDFKPDFIIISNPTIEHEQTIRKCIDWKCPLFIEKPALHKLNKAVEIQKMLTDHKIISYVACNLRFLASIIFVKQYLAQTPERIQEINIYCGSYLPSWRPTQNFREVYSAHHEMGGGVHLDLAHEFDYLYYFFGKPLLTHSLRTNRSALGISATDYANYQLIYEQFTANLVLNYFRPQYKRTCEIVLEKRILLLDLAKNTVYENEDVIFTSNQTMKDTYLSQMQYFVEKIKAQEMPMNNFDEHLNILKIILHETER